MEKKFRAVRYFLSNHPVFSAIVMGLTINMEAMSKQRRDKIPAPFPASPAVEDPAARCGDAGGLRILVVDDNEASAKTLAWTMEFLGYEVRLALNGTEAIKEAQSFIPDVLFLDIGLPGMNGYDLCRQIKSLPGLEKALYIAQTGWSQEEHRTLSRKAGFAHHLVKPVSMDDIEKILLSVQPGN